MIPESIPRTSSVFVIIKPDALNRDLVGWIIRKFEKAGLFVSSIEMKKQTYSWCRLHYAHLDQEVYKRVEPFMLSGKLIGIIFYGKNAVKKAREVAGSTFNSPKGTIRFEANGEPHENLVHVSDSAINTRREIQLFWGDCYA